MKRLNVMIAPFVAILALPSSLAAWNIPGHMLSSAIAHHILQWETLDT